jgi:serine/threonine protein kinase
MVMTATLPATATRPEFTGILPPGTMLHERYELGEMLGRGGMGAVYRARDITLDEVVALKIMRPEFAENPKMAERFLSEIKLARRVRHRNVCVIHDYGRAEGTLYISMELIEGVDLKKHIQRHGGLSAEQAFDMALQVADGLHAVHETGVVHRDLKPSNVVFGTDGIARLMDFGIAKRQSGSQGITATGDIVGTPEYMSPEQAQGRALDARSDVYALGVLVYELFSGELPFRGDTPISTILKHIQEPPPLDGPAAKNIPPP